MPFPGDILFSKDGTIGQTAITPKAIDFVVASSLIIIRPNLIKVSPEYLNFLLQSGVVVEQVESFVKGAALRRLSIQNLLKIFGTFPPINEQEEISSCLINQLKKFDELEAKANNLITLQEERGTALISAAVTGKIDVRNWKAPESLSQGTANV
jgi:type I restriction enzyme S subunit